MNSYLTLILIASVTLGFGSGSTFSAGPKYAPETKPLSGQNAYFKSADSTDYWELAPYYLPQHNAKACSVASVTMALNALRSDRKLTSSDELFTSEKLLKLEPAFAKATGTLGKGMTLDELQKSTQKVLETVFPGHYLVEIYRFNILNTVEPGKELARLKDLLVQNEKDPKNIMIANFLQGTVTGDPEGNVGHISPIAAYDSKSDQVLIFDTDRRYYEPYWVSSAKFLEAMNSIDPITKKARGLIWIRVK